MKKSIGFGALLSILLSGCASVIGAKTAEWPWKLDENGKTTICTSATCTAKDSIEAFNKAAIFCRDVQNYYEAGGQRANSGKVAVGAVGAIAGTVIAPIAHGTAATAWSGLSGATNAIQISIDETFSSTMNIKRRAAIAKEATNSYDNFKNDANGKNDDTKVLYAIQMALSCAIAPANAEYEALKNITK